MGEQNVVDAAGESEKLREFMQHLLQDLRALEKMIDAGMIEEGVRRIGAEQELFLVDADGRPAPVNQAFVELALDIEAGRRERGLHNLEPLIARVAELRPGCACEARKAICVRRPMRGLPSGMS